MLVTCLFSLIALPGLILSHRLNEMVQNDIDARGQIHTRKERLQRYLGLQMTIRDTGRDTTTITLDFSPKVEGVQYLACDSIVTGLINSIESRLGPGAQVADPTETRLPTMVANLSQCTRTIRSDERRTQGNLPIMNEIHQAYSALGLEPGAPFEAIAYSSCLI